MGKTNSNPVSSKEYSEEYFMEACQGFQEFERYKGLVLPRRLLIPFELANITNNKKILDLGSGRGEIVIQSRIRGSFVVGVDYSVAALKLARKNILNQFSYKQNRWIDLIQANSSNLPLKSEYFDIVFMLDVVEHLIPEELDCTMQEVYRLLVPGGKLIIHTMPNLDYYNYGYKLFRLFQLVRGINLPKNPRKRWEFSHVHVNEQTPRSLRNQLMKIGFNSTVWLQSVSETSPSENSVIEKIMGILTRMHPFKHIFCNDIMAIGEKPIKE